MTSLVLRKANFYVKEFSVFESVNFEQPLLQLIIKCDIT